MSGLQRAIGWIGTLQLAVLFAALIVRRHYRLLPLFTLYVGTVALTSDAGAHVVTAAMFGAP